MDNSLLNIKPELAAQWHPTRNGDLNPENVSAGSHKKAWWVCDKGHEWEGIIRNRINRGSGCHYCIGKKILQGFNDLATVKPEVAKWWHPTKNGNMQPQNYAVKSNTKVWWKCDKGHEWECRISDRTGPKPGGCPYCLNQKIISGFNDLRSLNPILAEEWNEERNNALASNMVSVGSDKKVWWKCDKGHEWEANITDRHGKKSRCPECFAGYQSSMPEKEIAEYLKTLLPDMKIETSVKSVIKPYELDIYIPEKNVAIEYNGLYWHSEENGKDKKYHYNKWLTCKEQGIQLIQIWEDDYIRNPELVKNMLAHKLGVSQQEKVYARKTVVKTLTKNETDLFLNANHIQGSVDARLKYGLFYNDELVSVMLLKSESGTEGKTLNLIRYATSKNVVGGFTKLLTYTNKQNPETESVITFSDNTVSDGGLYLNNGFVEDGEIKPDYMYIKNSMRNHKFSYRLKRFKNDPELQWVEGYTESQLAKFNNLRRIWDAGKIRWRKTF